MKKYENAQIEIVRIVSEDVISTSNSTEIAPNTQEAEKENNYNL